MTVSTTIFSTVAIVSVLGSALGLLGGLLPPLSPPSAPGSGGSGGPPPTAEPGDTPDAGGTGGTNSDGGSVWGNGGSGAGGVSPAPVPLSLAAAAQRALALEPRAEALWDLSIDESADALRRAALKVQEELRLEALVERVLAEPDPLDADEQAASREAAAGAYRQAEPRESARSARA